MQTGIPVKYPSFLDLKKIEFSWQIFEKHSNINFMKIIPVGTELFHEDVQTNRRTDRHNELYVS